MPKGGLDETTLDAYRIGITTLGHLARLFPAFYAQHVANRHLTPTTLYGIACAFLHQVNDALFPIMGETSDIEWWTEVPEQALRCDWAARLGCDPLALLAQAGGYLAQPRPAFYGVGVNELLDDDRELDSYSLLTVGLWLLVDCTAWRRGIDWPSLLADYPHDAQLRTLRMLVGLSDVQISALIDSLNATPIPLTRRRRSRDAAPAPVFDGVMLAYAFGETANAYANVTNNEIDLYYNGEVDVSWEQADELARDLHEAALIQARYSVLEAAIEAEPGALRRLAVALSRRALDICDAVWTATTPPRTLMALLGDVAPDEAEPAGVRAWLDPLAPDDDEDIHDDI